MRGFHTTVLTHLALGEVVPCRQEARRPKRTSEAKEQTMLLILPLRSKKIFLIATCYNGIFVFVEMNASAPMADCGPAPASAPIEKIVASRYGRV